jgi:hypothetical protein
MNEEMRVFFQLLQDNKEKLAGLLNDGSGSDDSESETESVKSSVSSKSQRNGRFHQVTHKDSLMISLMS